MTTVQNDLSPGMSEEGAEAVHTPVMLEEILQLLGPRQEREMMVDATLGEGGHSEAFLSRFPDMRIIGIDADPDIIERAQRRLRAFDQRIHFYTGWSEDFFAAFPEHEQKPDSILMDLGISRFHYEKSGRGFSFQRSEPLDMRIDPRRGQSAADLIRSMPEKILADLLFTNAEERFSRHIAHAIKAIRPPLDNSLALAEVVCHAVPPRYRYGPVHPATRTFQALRIAVNAELDSLPNRLEAALRVLAPGGRFGVITFHSLEDRIVKNFFKEKSLKMPIMKENIAVTVLTKKGLVPTNEELQRNPPSRSARFRCVAKALDGDN
ncbi:ribosomal RNA small subunit methyltransferase H [Spirochaetia bacterium]|nr:ribosomal RNA small subunit methyltransferase H [Spirochaetia bacterium]